MGAQGRVREPASARTALHHDGWLDAWLAESPDDPDALLVVADFHLHQAWKVRTSARAKDVERDQFQAFFALLEDAVPVIGAAAELNPADPVPWRIALTHARGTQAPREVFDAYLAEAEARDPHHFGCHAQALQYLCAKWYGSHEEMFRYAERVAASAPPGSRLHALPLQAALEYRLSEADEPEGPDPYGPKVDAALTRALSLSDTYDGAGDREAAGFRNELALLLIMSDRPAEALDVFRSIGVHATEYPWNRLGDPRAEFLEARSDVRLDLASRIPLFGRPPRPCGRGPRLGGPHPACGRDRPRTPGHGRPGGSDLRLLTAYGPGGRGLQLCRGGPRGHPRTTDGAASGGAADRGGGDLHHG